MVKLQLRLKGRKIYDARGEKAERKLSERSRSPKIVAMLRERKWNVEWFILLQNSTWSGVLRMFWCGGVGCWRGKLFWISCNMRVFIATDLSILKKKSHVDGAVLNSENHVKNKWKPFFLSFCNLLSLF
jgi:hypothetical protein